ncbi:MAG: hypothetical protein ACRBFS_09925 [Aureispira sp.]
MIPISDSPTTIFAKRFANNTPQRTQEAPFFSFENMPTTYAPSSRSAKEMTIHPLLAWSAAMPLLLWTGQEEAQSDVGGTLVFMACCAFVIGLFSKTGWRNEEPR